MKVEFSGTDFQKIFLMNFHENPSSESRVVLCGRTNWHDECRRRFSPLCSNDRASL